MCIIVSKEKGKSIPKKEILKNCFENNSDGAGFMYVNNGGVIIEKGFMDFESFYNRITELNKKINLKKRNVVFHFRISTSGKIDGATCHPYPITDKTEYLKHTFLKCSIGMVHNGILSNFVIPVAQNIDNLNDTQNFVKTFVYNLYKLNNKFLGNEYAKALINSSIGTSRLCFLTKDDNVYYFGNFIEEEGIKYSNSNYKPKVYTLNRFYNCYDYYNDYYEKFDKKSEKKEEFDEYFDFEEEELAFLNENMFYATYFKGYDYCLAKNNYCVDRDFNLYKKISEVTDKKGKKTITAKLLNIEVDIYSKDFKYLSFEEIKKVGVKNEHK